MTTSETASLFFNFGEQPRKIHCVHLSRWWHSRERALLRRVKGSLSSWKENECDIKVKDGRNSAAGVLLDWIQCCVAFSSHCGSAPEQNRIRWVVWHRCFQFFPSDDSTSLLPLTHDEITDVTHSTVSAGAQPTTSTK